MSAVFNCTRCHIKSLSPGRRQLLHSRTTEHNVTVCREDLHETSRLTGLWMLICFLFHGLLSVMVV